jgi:hypothetical protein
MAATPSAHWVSDSLSRRVPYPDKPFREQHDPHEISLGHGHRELAHLIEIVADASAPKAAKTKALRLLADVLPGREAEALELGALAPLRALLRGARADGLVLHALVCLDRVVDTAPQAQALAPDIPPIVDLLEPEREPPLRRAAAALLRHLADLLGPAREFIDGNVPIKIVAAAASPLTGAALLPELFDLLARLTNTQDVRVPLIANQGLLDAVVRAVRAPALRARAVNLAENIAMDISHAGKRALLEAGVLEELPPLLRDRDPGTRMSALALLALLAVPKEGKEMVAMAADLCHALRDISERDADLGCRRAAYRARIIVAELPMGRSVVGQVADPSAPVRMETSDAQLAGVKRANPRIADDPPTELLSPRSREKKLMPTIA